MVRGCSLLFLQEKRIRAQVQQAGKCFSKGRKSEEGRAFKVVTDIISEEEHLAF